MLTSQRKQLILEKLEAEGQVLSAHSVSSLTFPKIPFVAIYASWQPKGVCSACTAAHYPPHPLSPPFLSANH
jgi:hypothetical protein